MDDWSKLILRHRLRGLVIDTNLLLLYAIGLHRPGFIPRFKRTNKYTVADFELVWSVAQKFRRIVTTPHILSELSNLAIDRNAPGQPYFTTLVRVIEAAHELHVEKDLLVCSDAFPRMGLTDAAIVELAKRERYLVLTDELPLYLYLQGCERYVVNLNHLRTSVWFHGR